MLLGNSNGLVAVTDSRLSYQNGRPYDKPVPKLFKLDEETICTVAGFYADGGPELSDGEHPASTAASDLIDQYVALTRGHYLPLEQRVEMLTRIFQFSLNLVTRMNFAASSHAASKDLPAKPDTLILTVAGYDGNGSITVKQVYLIARSVSAGYEYFAVSTQRQGICANSYNLERDFECTLAGLSGVAETVLSGTDAKSKMDAHVIDFLRAKETGKLDALDVNEMIDLARYLKERSSDPPQEDAVGGPTQMAILKNGRVSEFDQPVKPLNWLKAVNFNMWDDSSIGLSRNYLEGRPPDRGGMLASATMGAMVVRGTATGIIQPLDNIIFVDSSFDRCVLTYDGSPMSMFDVTNKVTASKLIVSPGVELSSGLIKQIRIDFPDLQVEQAALPIPLSWGIEQAGPPRLK